MNLIIYKYCNLLLLLIDNSHLFLIYNEYKEYYIIVFNKIIIIRLQELQELYFLEN